MRNLLNIKKFCVLPTEWICVFLFSISQNKERLFPYTTVMDWIFLWKCDVLFCEKKLIS
jgi:hypothetical protein